MLKTGEFILNILQARHQRGAGTGGTCPSPEGAGTWGTCPTQPIFQFSWDGLNAALTRLKRIVMTVERLADVAAGDLSHQKFAPMLEKFDAALADDLNTPIALTALEEALAVKKVDPGVKRAVIETMDAVLGLNLFGLSRTDLRIRPTDAQMSETEIEEAMERRKTARAEKDFGISDAIRDELAAKGVDLMDGDPLGWDWKLG